MYYFQEQLLQPVFYDEDLTSSTNIDDHDHTLDIIGIYYKMLVMMLTMI